MSLHHESLYTRAPSMIAASSIFVANKIYEQMLVISGKTSPFKNHLSERFLLETLSMDFTHFISQRQVSNFLGSPNQKPSLASA